MSACNDRNCPRCGEGPRYPTRDPLCNCDELLHIYIQPGGHVHINCPVHGDRKVYGRPMTMGESLKEFTR